MSGRELPVAPAACALDAEGQAEQGARYRALAASVEAVDLGPGRLAVTLAAGFDHELLAKTVAVERGCCPFLRLDFDEAQRTLTIGVSHEHQEVLRGFADALSA